MYKQKKVSAIIVAAGASTRMGFDKLECIFNNNTVIGHSVQAFVENEIIDEIVLVLSQQKLEKYNSIYKNCTKPIKCVVGGAQRDNSVENGLNACENADIIAIHDAARPFVSQKIINETVQKAYECGGAAPAVAVKDTIKYSDSGEMVEKTPDRSKLYAVQTPQVFIKKQYIDALKSSENQQNITDDCMIFENGGYKVYLTKGEYSNYKITTKEDLKDMQKIKIGHGYDVHRLVEGRKLILGGVEIEHDKGLLGHSDADVLCHAISDALLGALALGDIGKHFPDTDKTYKNADSIVLLKKVVKLINDMGYCVSNIDATILCQAPKLRPFIDNMRENIAKAVMVDIQDVSVKATTEEGLGFTGTGEGISVHSVCLLATKI